MDLCNDSIRHWQGGPALAGDGSASFKGQKPMATLCIPRAKSVLHSIVVFLMGLGIGAEG